MAVTASNATTGTITSLGIGSGLDVNSIISQLVAIEKQPLTNLQTQASTIQTQISTYAQIKSLASTLNDAASALTLDRTWNALTADSSNSAVSVSVTGQSSAATYSIGVQQLASAQTSVSQSFTKGATLNVAGTLAIAVNGGAAVNVAYNGNDTLTTLAASINNSAAGNSVQALVVTGAGGKQQLMLSAKNTGESSKFTVDDSGIGGNPGAFNSSAITPGGESSGNSSFSISQAAQDAQITFNGVTMTSSTDTFGPENDTMAKLGLTVTVNDTTVSAARVTLAPDKDTLKQKIQDFIDAYNALNDQLSKSTASVLNTDGSAVDTSDGTGLFQGDASTVGLMNSLRMLTMGTATNATSTAMQRLADAGIQMQQGGDLAITDSSKLDAALDSPDTLKSMFAAKASSNGSGGGIAVNFANYTSQLLAYDGSLNSKTDALQQQATDNQTKQDNVNTRADAVQAQLTAQYTALDAQMATLSSLSDYMTQQVAAWNNSSKN